MTPWHDTDHVAAAKNNRKDFIALARLVEYPTGHGVLQSVCSTKQCWYRIHCVGVTSIVPSNSFKILRKFDHDRTRVMILREECIRTRLCERGPAIASETRLLRKNVDHSSDRKSDTAASTGVLYHHRIARIEYGPGWRIRKQSRIYHNPLFFFTPARKREKFYAIEISKMIARFLNDL